MTGAFNETEGHIRGKFSPTTPTFQWAVAGTVTDGFTIEGVDVGSIPIP